MNGTITLSKHSIISLLENKKYNSVKNSFFTKKILGQIHNHNDNFRHKSSKIVYKQINISHLTRSHKAQAQTNGISLQSMPLASHTKDAPINTSLWWLLIQIFNFLIFFINNNTFLQGILIYNRYEIESLDMRYKILLL